MSKEPPKHLTVFSSDTVNIKKLANLTANAKNYGQITPKIKPHSDPHKILLVLFGMSLRYFLENFTSLPKPCFPEFFSNVFNPINFSPD